MSAALRCWLHVPGWASALAVEAAAASGRPPAITAGIRQWSSNVVSHNSHHRTSQCRYRSTHNTDVTEPEYQNARIPNRSRRVTNVNTTIVITLAVNNNEYTNVASPRTLITYDTE